MGSLFQDPKTGKTYEQIGGEFYEISTREAAARSTAQELDVPAAGLAAMGGMFGGMARGARMRGAQITGDVEGYEAARSEQAAEDPYNAALMQERPVPAVAGMVAPFLAMPAISGAIPGALAGGVLGALTPEQDPLGSMGLGAGLGALGGVAVQRMQRARIPQSRAARVQGEIEELGRRAAPEGGFPAERSRPGGGGVAVESMDDLMREERAEMLAIAQGADPEIAQAAARGAFLESGMTGGMARTAPNRVHGEAVNRLTAPDVGMELTHGQRLGSVPIMRLDASLQSNPMTGWAFDAAQTKNQRIWNRIVNEALGETEEGDVTGRLTINRVGDQIDKTFTDTYNAVDALPGGGVNADLVDKAIRAVTKRWADWGIEIPIEKPLKASRFTGRLDEKGGEILRENYSGRGLVQVRQMLGQAAGDARNQGLTQRVDALREAQETIDRIVADKLGPKAQQDMDVARQRFRLMLALEKPGVWQKEQDVSMPGMYRALRQGFKRELNEGLSKRAKASTTPEIKKLLEVARAQAAVMGRVVPDSGTATRMSVQSMMSAPVRTLAQYGIGRAGMTAYNAAMKSYGEAIAGKFAPAEVAKRRRVLEEIGDQLRQAATGGT